MSDRAPMSVTIYACPEANKPAALAIIADQCDLIDYTDTIGEELTTEASYTADEATLGTPYEMTEALAELGAAFEITQDAKYEFDGITIMHTPELGTFEATSTNDGGIVVSSYTLDKITAEADTVEELRQAIDRATGKAWTEALGRALEVKP